MYDYLDWLIIGAILSVGAFVMVWLAAWLGGKFDDWRDEE